MPLEQLTLDRVTRVSRLKHTLPDDEHNVLVSMVILAVGEDSLIVQIDGSDKWCFVASNATNAPFQPAIDDWMDGRGKVLSVTDAEFKTLESMVECKACLEHGTGACQGECC